MDSVSRTEIVAWLEGIEPDAWWRLALDAARRNPDFRDWLLAEINDFEKPSAGAAGQPEFP